MTNRGQDKYTFSLEVKLVRKDKMTNDLYGDHEWMNYERSRQVYDKQKRGQVHVSVRWKFR